MNTDYDICVIGGFGHVGLPLSIAFATSGKKVCAYDIDKEKFDTISKGKMPFLEHDGENQLNKALASKNLVLSLDPQNISKSEVLIVVTGTPINIYRSPEFNSVGDVITALLDYIKDGQLIVLRSTVYPGTTERINHTLLSKGKKVDFAFCPERIAQGHALKELHELPQIVSGTSPNALKRAKELFSALTDDIIELEPKEAELAKLFTNSWRYIRFAAANQFFIIANDAGIDYTKIHKAITHKYERTRDIPKPGFAAGPCLFKDTVQLSAFNNNLFYTGDFAIQINQGLPFYIVSKLKKEHDLKNKKVGVLGMAFKANSDDKRDSLSYNLKNILKFEAKDVYCTDVYIEDPEFISDKELVERSDIIIVATPHKEYADLKFDASKIVVDIWDFYGKGSKI